MPQPVPFPDTPIQKPPLPNDPELVPLIRYRLRYLSRGSHIDFPAANDAEAVHKAFGLLGVLGKLRNPESFKKAGGEGVYRLPDGERIYPETKH